MSICNCGLFEIPLGMAMCNDAQNHVTHGVTACVSAGTDWERRAEAAEAAITRVRQVLDEEQRGYNPPLGLISRIRNALEGDSDDPTGT